MFNKIIKKYKLAPNSYTLNDVKSDYGLFEDTWNNHCDGNYWNWELSGLPETWINALQEILEIVKQHNPRFIIYQVKLKYGGIRIYLGNINGATEKAIQDVTELLFDEKLIW